MGFDRKTIASADRKTFTKNPQNRIRLRIGPNRSEKLPPLFRSLIEYVRMYHSTTLHTRYSEVYDAYIYVSMQIFDLFSFKSSRIKFLSSEWRKLPNAVVPCSLYGIICIGNKWNCESISFMKKHLNGFVFFVEMIGNIDYNMQNDPNSIFLFETKFLISRKNCVLLAMNGENKSSPLLIVDILFNADSEKKSLREYFLDKKLAVSNMGKRDDNLLTDLVECQVWNEQ